MRRFISVSVLEMNKRLMVGLGVLAVSLLAGYILFARNLDGWGERDDDQEQSAALAQAVNGARVSLEQGLSASERDGTPVSAKFEMEEGHLQLSIYTMKGTAFSEVIVDPGSGKILKTEPITEGDDLAAAKAQSGAMARAKTSLRAATEQAIKANRGFRAVSAVPALTDGQTTAQIVLVNPDGQFKTVTQRLQ